MSDKIREGCLRQTKCHEKGFEWGQKNRQSLLCSWPRAVAQEKTVREDHKQNIGRMPYQFLLLYDSHSSTVVLSYCLAISRLSRARFIRSRAAGTAGDAAELINTVEKPPPTNHITYTQQQQHLATSYTRGSFSFYYTRTRCVPSEIPIRTLISSLTTFLNH